MSFVEAGLLIGVDERIIHTHTPESRTSGSLPDDRDLWSVIWANRDQVDGFAHSHPGSGIPAPSHTDLTTFAAVEAGLGKRLKWWITSSDSMIVVNHCNLEDGGSGYAPTTLVMEPFWTRVLRKISNNEEV